MSQLGIEGATIGYDATNVQQALNNIHRRCIVDAVSKMNSAYSDLVNAVNEAWVGQSAETFKGNIAWDIKKVTEGLNKSYDILESEMHQIVNELDKVDNELVTAREDA